MNVTYATVRPGDASATFTISLPKWGGLESINTRNLGKPRQITFSPGEPPLIEYMITATLEQGIRFFPFRLLTPTRKSWEAAEIGSRLAKNESKLAYPLQRRLPELYFNDAEEDDMHFVVSLPPNTAFYTTNNLFFSAIGYDGHPALEKDIREIGGRGTRVVQKDVYGFFNETDQFQEIRGESTPPNLVITDVFPNVRFPKSIQFQCQVNDVPEKVIRLPMNMRALPANRDMAVMVLTTLSEAIRIKFDLKENPFEIAAGVSPKTLLWSNRATENEKAKIVVHFPGDLAQKFGFTPVTALTFKLDTPRTYTLEFQSQPEDPFSKLYPVTAKVNSFGNSVSYVEGFGYLPILAVFNDQLGQCPPIITNGLMFNADKTYLTVEFIDKDRQIITFQHHYTISMLFSFQHL